MGDPSAVSSLENVTLILSGSFLGKGQNIFFLGWNVSSAKAK